MQHLTNSQNQTIQTLHDKIKKLVSDENSGHDFGHIMRVVNLTQKICTPDADTFVVLCCAYLHEFLDDKMNVFDTKDLHELALQWNLDFEGNTSTILDNISKIGYKGGFQKTKDRTLEAHIVSDADILDAMGAIGIARTFYYAGYKGLPFHDRDLEGIVATNLHEYRNGHRNAIAHFDEKILHLYDALETKKAQEIGKIRHERVVRFYNEFYEEIKGE